MRVSAWALMSGPTCTPRSKPGPTRSARTASTKAGTKRGDARLAGDPEVLDGDGALDGGHEVGVVEDDERCVAAQLETEPLDLRGGAGHDRAAGRRGAGEGDLPDERVIEQLFLERPGRAGGDHVEGAGREPGIVGDSRDGERRQRR